MTAERSRLAYPDRGASVDVPRVAQNQQFVGVAEKELTRALSEQVRPPLGMYVHPSSAETAAFQCAVREICSEAHRLDLRAEELLIGIKQAWSQLATLRALHLGERDGDVLREVVSNAIETFFEARESGDRQDG